MKTQLEIRRKYQELFDKQAQASIRRELNVKAGIMPDIADMIIEDCKQQMRILAWVLDGEVT